MKRNLRFTPLARTVPKFRTGRRFSAESSWNFGKNDGTVLLDVKDITKLERKSWVTVKPNCIPLQLWGFSLNVQEILYKLRSTFQLVEHSWCTVTNSIEKYILLCYFIGVGQVLRIKLAVVANFLLGNNAKCFLHTLEFSDHGTTNALMNCAESSYLPNLATN